MKILTSSQIKELDAYTIQNEPISSIDLMERASRAFAEKFISYFSNSEPNLVHIFCGLGNNGGDGLAVARILHNWGYNIKVSVVRFSENSSKDFEENYNRLSKLINIHNIYQITDIPKIGQQEVIIDAIFGSGLNRAVEGIAGKVIQKINESHSLVFSIDIPSGLLADSNSNFENIILANYTFSFQVLKLAFLFPLNEKFVGSWQVLDIKLDSEKLTSFENNDESIEGEQIKRILKPRSKFAHKGNFGKALLIVGSYGKMGAGILASRACMRAGVGLLTAFVPHCGYDIMQNSVPEVMVIPDKSQYFIHTYFEDLQSFDVIGMGCGLGQKQDTLIFLDKLLEKNTKPLVIDADAINLMAQDESLLEKVSKNSIFTPHFKEFERLLGKIENDFERIEKMRSFCKQKEVYMILKGANTAIATPTGKIYFNTETGNPGMATAGSGDVLAGILTGLLAQGYSSEETCFLGVFLHGLAGDIAKNEVGENSLIASDIINYLPKAFLKIQE